MPEDIALFIDFENIRYSMLNIQRREPDPQELIAVARRYGTVMVARAYADWSRQPEPFKGSLTAAMIDRVDCPAKQRDRIRMGTFHYASGNTPSGALGSPTYIAEQGAGGPYPRQWPSSVTGNSGHFHYRMVLTTTCYHLMSLFQRMIILVHLIISSVNHIDNHYLIKILMVSLQQDLLVRVILVL